MVPFRVFAIKVCKIGPPFTRTLARDQHRGLLIAFPNEHPDLDHQSVCLFSQIWLYLIKYLQQLELWRTCSTDIILQKGAFFKFFEYRACTDSGSTGHRNVPNIVSLIHCLEQLYFCILNSYVKACLNIWWRRVLFTSCRRVY